METHPLIAAVRCVACGSVQGNIVSIDGVELLDDGPSLVRAKHATCKACGADFHWVMSDRMLSRLITRVLDQRGKID